MANSPPTINVTKYKGTGSPQVFPLLPTQVLGSQDGADLGTGGGVAPVLETPPAGTFTSNRNIEFLDDRYALMADSGVNTWGIFKRDQGGAGQWGKVVGDSNSLSVDGHVSGLFVLHPGGVPTLAMLAFDSAHELRLWDSTDGTTWVGVGTLVETNGSSPISVGQAIVFRDSIVWAHETHSGGAGAGQISQYDLNLSTLTRYDTISIFFGSQGCFIALHVHDNVLFALSWGQGSVAFARLAKLQAGSFQTVFTSSDQDAGVSIGSQEGHHGMFTDPATGDLILILCGDNQATNGERAQVLRVENATTTATPVTDISTTVMGSVEGADKYLEGGSAADRQRRWSVYVDSESDPSSPRTFLWTWVPGGTTECWEWKGVSAEMEAVASLSGIADDFALPYNAVGGGHRSPRVAAVELGDTANPPVEAVGGTKVFFRGRGSASVGTLTFYGVDDEGTPSTVVPIVAGSLVEESGVPPSSPSISGNAITNFTPDNGATLYSVVLDVDAVGVNIFEGSIGLIIPDFV